MSTNSQRETAKPIRNFPQQTLPLMCHLSAVRFPFTDQQYLHDNPGVVLHDGVAQVESPEVHEGCTLQNERKARGSQMSSRSHGSVQRNRMHTCIHTYHHRLWHCGLKSIAEFQQPPLIVPKQDVFLMTLQEHGLTHPGLLQRGGSEGNCQTDVHGLHLWFKYA